ncbi:hypothetical protein OAO01_08345 [Oligoflexia bacterium]|nr:hypothetical protein [Oligoflexia bacterium]
MKDSATIIHKRAGRPTRGLKKRVRASFTLRPEDVAWLNERATLREESKSETLEMCIALAKKSLACRQHFATELVEGHPTVYWDVDIKNVDGMEHASFLIERMLEHGTLSGIQDLLIAFPRKQIAEVIRASRRISRKTALFWKNYINIEGSINCLEKESQNPLSRPWE